MTKAAQLTLGNEGTGIQQSGPHPQAGGFPTDPQELTLSSSPPLPPPECFQSKVSRQDVPDFDHLWALNVVTSGISRSCRRLWLHLGSKWSVQCLAGAPIPSAAPLPQPGADWLCQKGPSPRPALPGSSTYSAGPSGPRPLPSASLWVSGRQENSLQARRFRCSQDTEPRKGAFLEGTGRE